MNISGSILARLRAGVLTASSGETRTLAQELTAVLPADAILALHGDMGAGKTTFVQGLAQGFGVEEAVTSPTFNIYTLHRGSARLLVHVDAYRLRSGAQLSALMIDDFVPRPPFCVAVEWPDNVASWLPERAWHLRLAITADGRHAVQLG
jgi:tRNA threonylcarbamoyladenosine biosynthesis protein TsaE